MKTLTINGSEYTAEDVVELMELAKQFLNELEDVEDKSIFRRNMVEGFAVVLMQMDTTLAELMEVVHRHKENAEIPFYEDTKRSRDSGA